VSPVPRDNVIVALDTADATQALALARTLHGHARWVKVGMTLYYAEGPGVVGELRDLGFEVFVDLKLHDIPHQVAGAAAVLARLGAGMLTVHASGGRAVVSAAVDAARASAEEVGLAYPAVLAVTVLTSIDTDALRALGVAASPKEQVERLATVAIESGADGVVCSPLEASAVRELLGPNALVVTPGVRPAWSDHGDQARVASPAEAFAWGASHVVVGRPVTGAADPAAAFERLVAEEA